MQKKVLSPSINFDVLIGLYAGFAVALVFITEKAFFTLIGSVAVGVVIFFLLIKKRNKILIVRFGICLLSVTAWICFYVYLSISNVPKIILKNSEISVINGKLVKDSLRTNNGRNLYSVKITSVENTTKGIKASSSGVVSITMPYTAEVLKYGQQASFYVKNYKNGMYSAYKMKKGKTSFIVKLRSALYEDIYDRIRVLNKIDNSVSAYYSRNLASMLLLGSGDSEESIKKDAALIGLAHIFALSGMHLMLIANAIKKICKLFFPPHIVSLINSLILCIYVFIIGPLPSLIRAFFMYILSENFKKIKPYLLFISVILQSLFFPYTITSLAFKLSYVCVWALYTFNIFMSYSFSYPLIRGFSPLLASSVTAVLFSSPVSIRNFGYWSPLGIVLSPFIMILCVVCMLGGVFNILFCPSDIGAFLMKYSYIAVKFIIDFFIKKAPQFSWGAYVILILIIIFLFVLKTLLYKRLIAKRY